MNYLKKVMIAFIFVAFIAAPAFAIVTPTTTHAAANSCEKSILGISPWYKGLTEQSADGKCSIVSPVQSGSKLALQEFIWRIALNIIGIVLGFIGYIAFFFVLYGGFLFLTGGNNPSQIEKARKTLLNAVIGLVIAIAAVAIVNLIFSIVGPVSTVNGIDLPTQSADELLKNGLNLAYGIAGILAVVVIILGGLTYVTSAGNSTSVTKAKNTILYAVVGLIVVIFAYAITNYVIGRF